MTHCPHDPLGNDPDTGYCPEAVSAGGAPRLAAVTAGSVREHMEAKHGLTAGHWSLCGDPMWCHGDDHAEDYRWVDEPDIAVTPHTHDDATPGRTQFPGTHKSEGAK